MNVLHAPVNIGSHPSALAEAENEVRRGLASPGRSWSVDFEPIAQVSGAHEVFPRPPGIRGKIHCAIKPFLYGLRHVRQFNVLHLYFGKSLLRFEGRLALLGGLDLPLWKALGKRIFATFQGCDARLRGRSADKPFSPCRLGVCTVPGCDAILDRKRVRSIGQFCRWADKLFCVNPDLLPFVPGAEFLPYACVPADLPATTPQVARRRPLIVHAPSNRSIKGTALLEAASMDLQSTHPHELRLVEGVSRAQALRVYAQADILVDQLRIGWYGGLAVEAMAMGVPVVAYLREDDLARIPPQMRSELPIVNASAAALPATLADLFESPQRRRELGSRGPAFVRRWHDPAKIARRMLELYADPRQSFWEGYRPEE